MVETVTAWQEGHSSFAGSIGVARREITPPIGINSRMWGSAVHDTAAGIHRPLTATVLHLAPANALPVLIASLDLGWWRSLEDEWFFRRPILDALGVGESQLLIHLTHTHAGPAVSLQAADKPGGELIQPYLEEVRSKVIDAFNEAKSMARPASMHFHRGRCQLACDRNQVLTNGETVVGYTPQSRADDAVVVGRVATEAGEILATLVNYACHPTTLGGTNTLISPDYVGAMRELVESSTQGAPCLFLLGAAGDLAPRRQYVADTAVADQNGRQLGYSVLATLEDMLPTGARLTFDRVEESTARLGHWRLEEDPPNELAASRCVSLSLPLSRTHQIELHSEMPSEQDRASLERIERMLNMWCGLENSESASIRVLIHRLGDAVIVSVPGEMHSAYQRELRRRFPNHAVLVVNLVNGSQGYFPPLADFRDSTYQCRTTLFEPGAHEAILEATTSAIESLLAPQQAVPDRNSPGNQRAAT